WLRYHTKRLRLEAEATYVYGTFDVTDIDNVAHLLTVSQFGGAFEGEYHFLADGALTLAFNAGVASGDPSAGFGNQPNRTPTGPNGTVPPGSIEGPQFYCAPGQAVCQDGRITNFSFNPDYHVDMILWRELLGGVTDAWYAKPTLKYTLTEGLDMSASAIYSQALFYSSTPGGHTPLGLEADAGIHYVTDDGFIANLDYGILFPFAGLGESDLNGNFVYPGIAQAIRMMLGVRY
ncbi:MAG: TIGR04551 family protein, partial [Deltaproteobacteria bacterium]